MHKYYNEITGYIDTHRDEMLEKWKILVNLEGRFDEADNVRKAQEWLRKEMEESGFECYIHEVAANRCGILVGMLGHDRPGKPIGFSGHIDTVHPKGSFGGDNPFYIKDGKAYGPGVLDMKGGIIIALYVVKALNSIGYDKRPIKFMFAGEEEGDHTQEGNDADIFFREESGELLCDFNMETGHITNSLCVGRKTQYTFFTTVHGIGGHAGNEFTKCHNALHEAVLKVADLIKLTDFDKGTSVTASVMHCGKNTSSIPDTCEFAVDVRITNELEGQRICNEFDRIMKHNYVDGTTTEYNLIKAKLHAFEPTGKILWLLDAVNNVAADNGYEKFGSIELGGASDAGAIAQANIPVLCSCGVIGEFNHNRREYAVVQSLFDRTVILTLTVLSIDES